MMKVDLHTHSTFSDGGHTPEQLVAEAVESGIGVLGLTDHDSWDGIERAVKAAKKYGNIRILPGVELSTTYKKGDFERSVHVLGYYVDRSNEPLHDKMSFMRERREERIEKMCGKLRDLGYEITYDDCVDKTKFGSVGRPLIAKALVRLGYMENTQQAFDELLRGGKPAYVPQMKMSPAEAVELIHKAGGLAVLAHPSEINNVEFVTRLVAELPFDGIEVYHPSVRAEENMYEAINRWLQLAKEHNLLVTGGSDFHGNGDRFPAELGIWTADYEDVRGILEYKNKKISQNALYTFC